MASDKLNEPLVAFRRAALGILGRAFEARLESQRRVWRERAEVARLESDLGAARVRLEAEERELTEAREMLVTIWRDVREPEKALIGEPDVATE